VLTLLSAQRLSDSNFPEAAITPLLRVLGYRSGTENHVIREQSLRYPKAFLGRKDPSKDPPLRGKADYILEVQRAVRWVIEAKAPDVEIGADAIEQAWSYANHPEVRAVYFALCNGRQFVVFQTNRGPDNPPLLSISYEAFPNALRRIQNVVGPEALLRDHPKQEVDIGDPIGPGLRSVARITNGLIRYERSSLAVPVLSELQIGIAEGAVERDEEDRLLAYVRTTSPIRSLQALNERLGLTAFEMFSPDKYLSVDPNRPTGFLYENRITIPAGEEVLDLNTWRSVVFQINIRCATLAEASGVLVDRVFRGNFVTNLHYVDLGLRVSLSGSFEARLA
jgi:Type I restriction enzyme R protein N terminus (HSDR_N)